jgi:hypothetical protein
MITFSMVVRNDNYGGNFASRLQKVLDNLFILGHKWALDAEIILVEWNNPIGVPEIQDVVNCKGTLPVRIIHVPKEIHDRILGSYNHPLFFGYGHNVAIRRAKGDFILASTADIIYSEATISFLALTIQTLNRDCFYSAIRHDINEDGKVINVRDGEPYMGLHMNACGDFTLMAKSRWEEIRGYPEVPFNTYIDGTVLWLAHQAGMKQVVLKEPIYHMNHEETTQAVLDLSKFPLPMNSNENWGFRGVNFRETEFNIV